MSVFRSIVFTAALSGLIVGAAVTGLQHLGTVPLIQQGEAFEEQAKKAGPAPAASVAATVHQHADGSAHVHEADAWEPKDGLERNAYTALANVMTGIGFALMLAGAFALLGRPVTWREGLFWGLGGFAAFTLAPGLGLPPELPGMPAAALEARQAWWIATAVLTAAGLWLIAFKRAAWAAALAIILIAAPHVVGANETGVLKTHGYNLNYIDVLNLQSLHTDLAPSVRSTDIF
ncbi:MAG: CbtA family protein, partial [Beijerinckiaceae bacterium]|nr:CbtA family protein [Beijerinckiaceae bacterium]